MATLVLTAVGQALGGPAGAALGSFVGRSIDESLFGAGPRRGPRLGDLSVQTSSYGSFVPRVYGTMRVAGTVVWSTDLIEREVEQGGGKGSAPSIGYAYSVSLAVALSSRPILDIRRVWADGRLVRGEAGDWKIKTKFRLATGDEDQDIDPIIGSIEGPDSAPAFRGQALAIFEDLELSEFGNRIPQFTFEVCGDDGGVEVGKILVDASGGVVDPSRADRSVSGFAAYGKSQADAIQDLVELFDVQLSERGGILVDAGSVAVARQPIADELGCSADEQAAPILRRVQHSHEIPSRMTVSYYEPTRDYQSGLAEAFGGIEGGGERKVELAAAIGAEQARALANNVLVGAGEEAERVSICLPPTEMDIQVGETVVLPNGNAFAVRAVTIDSMVSKVELGRSSTLVDAVPADAGTSVGTPDLPIGRTSLALVEVPANAPDGGLRLVASNAGAWRPVTAELFANGSTIGAVRVGIRGTVGTVESALDAGASDSIDGVNELVVALANPAQPLFNADIDGLLGGANLAMVGDELIQFASAEPLGNGRWRLRTLLRGLWGSEWASSSHVVGEPFCLVDRAGVDLAAMTNANGTAFRVEAHGVSDAAPLPSAERTLTRDGERPMAPCRLRWTADTEAVTIEWTARDRTLWGWGDAIDPVDPRFLVTIAGASGEIVRDAAGCSLSLARADLAGIGEGTLTVRVEAVGAGLRSRALVRTLTL